MAWSGGLTLLLLILLGTLVYAAVANELARRNTAILQTRATDVAQVISHPGPLSDRPPFGFAFGGPAYQSLIPSLVDKKDLPNAVALNSIQSNVARVLGPTLFAATLGWLSVPGPPVEAVIALSIMFLASELAQPPGDPPSFRARDGPTSRPSTSTRPSSSTRTCTGCPTRSARSCRCCSTVPTRTRSSGRRSPRPARSTAMRWAVGGRALTNWSMCRCLPALALVLMTTTNHFEENPNHIIRQQEKQV